MHEWVLHRRKRMYQMHPRFDEQKSNIIMWYSTYVHTIRCDVYHGADMPFNAYSVVHEGGFEFYKN